MDYQHVYHQLIHKGKNRLLSESDGAMERHHIIPKCIGGTDEVSNIVSLTPEEHYMAHLLLVKIYPSENKLWYAANMMKSRVKNNKEYGWFKRKFVQRMREERKHQPRTAKSREKQSQTCLEKYSTGYIHPMKGKSLSETHKRRISNGNKNKKIPTESRVSLDGYILRYGEEVGTRKYHEDCSKKDSKSPRSYIRRFGEVEGKRLYEERRTTLSDTKRGNKNHFYGKNHTEESKKRMKDAARSRPVIICPHCGKQGTANIMKRWHFERCKDA